ncbi:MAG TPA: helix-turn-helix domain-containing protein [Streptosporangiaceae bacterium]|jgi:AcrR family transcriptional regulator
MESSPGSPGSSGSPDLVAPTRGGRGARERILRAAADLFYADGINTTGMERLTEAAHVSKRTFYQHFPSKAALVEAYLHGQRPSGEQTLDRDDLSPRDRLLGLFAERAATEGRFRGCPYHNAAVETAGALPEVQAEVVRHKQEFAARLIETARAAGARDPEGLGRQLAVLFEGAKALSTSLNDGCPADDARQAAITLIDAAMTGE